jgi:hypothetical protein
MRRFVEPDLALRSPDHHVYGFGAGNAVRSEWRPRWWFRKLSLSLLGSVSDEGFFFLSILLGSCLHARGERN